jgi:hypothetical protein
VTFRDAYLLADNLDAAATLTATTNYSADVDGDGEVTFDDGAALASEALGSADEPDLAGDVDDDGAVEDVDGDGEFTISDVAVFVETFEDEHDADRFDQNGDGDVTIRDVAILLDEL